MPGYQSHSPRPRWLIPRARGSPDALTPGWAKSSQESPAFGSSSGLQGGPRGSCIPAAPALLLGHSLSCGLPSGRTGSPSLGPGAGHSARFILAPGNDHDVRGAGPGGGLSGHSVPLWHGVPGAQRPGAHALCRVLAEEAPGLTQAPRGAVPGPLCQLPGGE